MAEYYFSAYQIAEMAMSVEDAGAKFYETLANLVNDANIKNVFLTLAKAELQHKQSFRSIADAFRNDDKTEYSIDLSSLMKTHIDRLKQAAFNMQTFSKTPTTIQDAVKIAIHTEKEAIGIFTEMINNFVAKFHGVINNIIGEEKRHLEMLIDIENRLKLQA